MMDFSEEELFFQSKMDKEVNEILITPAFSMKRKTRLLNWKIKFRILKSD